MNQTDFYERDAINNIRNCSQSSFYLQVTAIAT